MADEQTTGGSPDNPAISTLLEMCRAALQDCHDMMAADKYGVDIPRALTVRSQQVIYLLHDENRENHVIKRGINLFLN